jgi:hypothetical protein
MINMIYSNDYPIENKLALQLAQSSITSTLEWFKSTFVSDINSQFVLALSPSKFRNNVLKTMSVLSDDLNNSPFAAKSLTNALISKNITYKTPANDLTENYARIIDDEDKIAVMDLPNIGMVVNE